MLSGKSIICVDSVLISMMLKMHRKKARKTSANDNSGCLRSWDYRNFSLSEPLNFCILFHFSLISMHYFVMWNKKESKILKKPWLTFLAWVRSWIFMFKLVSEIQEWFLGNLLRKSCSFPLLPEVCVNVSQKKKRCTIVKADAC